MQPFAGGDEVVIARDVVGEGEDEGPGMLDGSCETGRCIGSGGSAGPVHAPPATVFVRKDTLLPRFPFGFTD